MNQYSFDKIVNHAKVSGFVFQGSELYGGLANTWDYGPLGVELIKNIKDLWWQKFVREASSNVGLDSAILMNPSVWQASGHLSNFTDPLMDCKKCKTRHRADKLIEDAFPNINCGGWSEQQLKEYIDVHKIACPNCGGHDFTEIRRFQMMFKTFQGVVEDASAAIYLRPETAQGIFVNFKNVLRSSRRKLPMGIAQIGKVFRNEITPGNFIFRTREFEQMELEFFCKPGEDMKWYEYWRNYCMDFLLKIRLNQANLRLREHEKEELSHYSTATSDIEYEFPFGWGELWGIANRTDFDLRQHQLASNESMEYLDPMTNERFIPYCVEPSVGVGRLALALLCDAYDEELIKEGDSRIVLRLHPVLAPIKACVTPLSKQLAPQTQVIYQQLSKHFACEYDETGSIGKRYRRQDAIGTPFCITFDFDSVEDHCVTVRERDSMLQERVAISSLETYLSQRLSID